MDSSPSGKETEWAWNFQGLFLAFPGITQIQRFQSSLDRDSIDGDGKYCKQICSTIYTFVPAKSAVHTRGTNHSVVHTRAANHSASDIGTVLAFLPGLIIYEQNNTAQINSQVRNVIKKLTPCNDQEWWRKRWREKNHWKSQWWLQPCRRGYFDRGCFMQYWR